MQKISRCLVCLPLLFLLSPSHAQIIKLTPSDKQHLLTEKFHIVARAEALPISVQKEFARKAHDSTFKMANPEQEFQVTDSVIHKHLPFRRLIFAGLTNNLCLLHYEHGGIGDGYDLVLFRLWGGKAHFVWHGSARRRIPNIAELRKDMESNRFDNWHSYYL